MMAMFENDGVDEMGRVRLRATGPITGRHAVSGDTHPFAEAIGDDWENAKIAIDLQATNYVDSAGIGWLLANARQIQAAGGAVVLCSLGPQLKEAFDLMRISFVLPIADDVSAACDLLSEAA